MNYTVTSPEGTALRMLDKYTREDALDRALDYRQMYDRGTNNWRFWNDVLNYIQKRK